MTGEMNNAIAISRHADLPFPVRGRSRALCRNGSVPRPIPMGPTKRAASAKPPGAAAPDLSRKSATVARCGGSPFQSAGVRMQQDGRIGFLSAEEPYAGGLYMLGANAVVPP
jgi:hypothetical protein